MDVIVPRNILFYRIDELDGLVSSLHDKANIKRAEFVSRLHRSIKGKRLSADEVDLLFRVFKGKDRPS